VTGAFARRGLPALAAAALLAGCATTTPGTGWSRAPDLSVYGSMRVFARNAVEENVLCQGWRPERASQTWAREFGARQAAIDEAMARKYGAETMARQRTPYTPRIACPAVEDLRWHHHYARLLRLLEVRLGLMPEREG
jgi:hypothetical protein